MSRCDFHGALNVLWVSFHIGLCHLTFILSFFFFFHHDRQAYTKVAGKYQDVLALEQSVAELHQMFLDFALLTEQQGELIDQIEFNVKSAADYVEEANVDVYHAIESSKSIRKKQWYAVIHSFTFFLCSFYKFHALMLSLDRLYAVV